MVRGLVQEEDVRVAEHSARERELHAPPAGEGGDRLVERGDAVALGEADREYHLLDVLLPGDALLPDGVEAVLDVHRLLESLHVRVNEDGLELLLGWEAVNLVVGDGAEERRLARGLGRHDAVALAALEVEAGIVEEDAGPVRQGELAVAEVLALLLVVVLERLGVRRRAAAPAGRTWTGTLGRLKDAALNYLSRGVVQK